MPILVELEYTYSTFPSSSFGGVSKISMAKKNHAIHQYHAQGMAWGHCIQAQMLDTDQKTLLRYLSHLSWMNVNARNPPKIRHWEKEENKDVMVHIYEEDNGRKWVPGRVRNTEDIGATVYKIVVVLQDESTGEWDMSHSHHSPLQSGPNTKWYPIWSNLQSLSLHYGEKRVLRRALFSWY